MHTPRRLVLAIGLAVLAATTAPAGASTPQHPILATGRILDAAGHPVDGPIEVRAWPTGMPMSVGDVVDPPLVTTGSADGAGLFTLRAVAGPELRRLAEVNNGYLNFVMAMPGGGEWHFSRYLGKQTTLSHGSGVRWTARPETQPEPLEVSLPPASTFGTKAAGNPTHERQPYMCGHYEVIRTERGSTKVGEINAEGDTAENLFVYGEGNTADSDISVAVKGRGPWQLTGTHHVGTSDVARIGHHGGQLESMWFSSGFDYHLMRDECNREKVIVHQWRGGIERHPQINQGCTVEPYRGNREPYGAGDFFERSANRAVTWTAAAEIFGASLTASSGFSEEVHMRLKFGSERLHWVCGDDDVAILSKRVFSGNSSPV
jgi:hypothetical protein